MKSYLWWMGSLKLDFRIDVCVCAQSWVYLTYLDERLWLGWLACLEADLRACLVLCLELWLVLCLWLLSFEWCVVVLCVECLLSVRVVCRLALIWVLVCCAYVVANPTDGAPIVTRRAIGWCWRCWSYRCCANCDGSGVRRVCCWLIWCDLVEDCASDVIEWVWVRRSEGLRSGERQRAVDGEGLAVSSRLEVPVGVDCDRRWNQWTN